jgi:ferredoxin-NADP reductase
MTVEGYQQARLIESSALNEEIRHYVFESLEKAFAFEPGQHVALSKTVDGGVLKRYYSIASPPNGTRRFELCINAAHDNPVAYRLGATGVNLPSSLSLTRPDVERVSQAVREILGVT